MKFAILPTHWQISHYLIHTVQFNLFKLLFIIFLLVPLLEIYLLIEIGSQIGAIATIALVLFTAALGVFLLRLQGLATITKVRNSVDQGELPAVALLEGLLLLIAGALLLTPGFFTDFIGFLFLTPQVRSHIANKLLLAIIVSQKNHQNHQNHQNNVLEGEFWEEDK